MTDLFIDFAGQRNECHRIHCSLSRLQAGDKVNLERGYTGRVWVLGQQHAPVARLSEAAARRWPPSRLEQIDEVRGLGMVCRTQDDSGDPIYRDRLRAHSWEVPILEVRERQ